jgi:dTDP-D-glucose 4,6-dehydratase
MAAPQASEEFVPQRILITGGAGFIASHVATRLVQRYPQYKVMPAPPGMLALLRYSGRFTRAR